MSDAIGLELSATIARIRRATARNADVMKLCDFAEEQLRQRAARRRPEGPRFDKRTFMRNYMRAWRKKRAAEKAKGAGRTMVQAGHGVQGRVPGEQ